MRNGFDEASRLFRSASQFRVAVQFRAGSTRNLLLSAKNRTAPSCFWCEGVDAQTMEMAKWADSPAGKPDRAAPHSFD